MMIKVENAEISYGREAILKNVNIYVESGEIGTVIGPNGSGKTALLKSIAGIIKAKKGKIQISGQAYYLPQSLEFPDFMPITAMEMVLSGRFGKNGTLFYNRNEVEKALDALDKVGMRAFAEKKYVELSQGQKQKVMLAQAICSEANILLLDEPYSGIDVWIRDKIFDAVQSLAGEGRTVLISSHDISTVSLYSNTIICIHKGTVEMCEPESMEKAISRKYGKDLNAVKHRHGRKND